MNDGKGEENTAYFCVSEKRRQERNAIHALIINYAEYKD